MEVNEFSAIESAQFVYIGVRRIAFKAEAQQGHALGTEEGPHLS